MMIAQSWKMHLPCPKAREPKAMELLAAVPHFPLLQTMRLIEGAKDSLGVSFGKTFLHKDTPATVL